MVFEWDKAKAESNEAKHGVSFDVAMLVFEDANCLVFVDAMVDGEQRWHAIGAASGILLLTVVHTYREDGEEIIRIISARAATRNERKRYAENLE